MEPLKKYFCCYALYEITMGIKVTNNLFYPQMILLTQEEQSKMSSPDLARVWVAKGPIPNKFP